MSPETRDWWTRAERELVAAGALVSINADAAASRAYYAAFYAVSALFAAEEREFRRHSALEAAVHRELVRSGRWPEDLGADYSWLIDRRLVGDYGGARHVTLEEAQEAIVKARRIVETVGRALGQR